MRLLRTFLLRNTHSIDPEMSQLLTGLNHPARNRYKKFRPDGDQLIMSHLLNEGIVTNGRVSHAPGEFTTITYVGEILSLNRRGGEGQGRGEGKKELRTWSSYCHCTHCTWRSWHKIVKLLLLYFANIVMLLWKLNWFKLLTLSELEIELDFPAMDVLLWQVFGISDFFANKICLWTILDLKDTVLWCYNTDCILLCKANK